MSGWSMAQLLQAHEIDCSSVKPFLLVNAERVKAHAVALARKHGRPFEYLSSKLRKEDAARKIAERDGIVEGLVCVFSALEPCRTFSLRFTTGQPYVQSAKRKCLHLYYYYFIDRDLGLIHVRVQTWFPLQVQVYLNGHEWLARKLTARGIEHTMYDKAGLVLRIETVINNPKEFRVRKQVLRDGKQRAEWVQLRKGVAYLFRYREVSLQANARYLDALAAVDDPTKGKQALQRLTTAKKDAAGRSCPGFNPLAQLDADLFKSLMDGEHSLRGFTNRDIRSQLTKTRWLRSCADDAKKASAKVGRCFRRLHAHGLIAKIPRTRRWRVTAYGHQAMGTTLYLREHHFPNVYATAAAA